MSDSFYFHNSPSNAPGNWQLSNGNSLEMATVSWQTLLICSTCCLGAKIKTRINSMPIYPGLSHVSHVQCPVSWEAFVCLIAAIMSGNRTSNKETSRQTAGQQCKETLRHVFPISSSSPHLLLSSPLLSVLLSFRLLFLFAFSLLTFAMGFFFVVDICACRSVDSCGCLVSTRNKYEHHVNSLDQAQWAHTHTF